MVDIAYQRRMASQILKCGQNRVWIDPQQVDEVAEAVTRDDIRRLIVYRVIQKHQKKGVSRIRARKRKVQRLKGRRRGEGTRKGPLYARTPRKQQWIKTIRPIREELRRLRSEGTIDDKTYRAFYKKARGGMFKSRNHLLTQMQTGGIIAEGAVKRGGLRKKRIREDGSRALKTAKARDMVKRKAAETKAQKMTEAKSAKPPKKGTDIKDSADADKEE